MDETLYVEHELLGCIEDDIEKKYNITNPIFIYNFKKYDFKKFKDREAMSDWFEVVTSEKRFVKYKHIKDNIFELKDFSPDPSDEVCNNDVLELVKIIKTIAFEKHSNTSPFFKIGYGIYNEKEAKKELLLYLKNTNNFTTTKGNLIKDLKPHGNRIIYEVSFGLNSIQDDIRNGFIELENKY